MRADRAVRMHQAIAAGVVLAISAAPCRAQETAVGPEAMMMVVVAIVVASVAWLFISLLQRYREEQ